MRLIAAVFARDWRLARQKGPALALDVLSVLLSAVVFYYLAAFIDHRAEYFPFVVAGLTILRIHSAVPRVLAATTARIADGSLEIMLTGRSHPAVVLTAEATFEILRGTLFSTLLVVLAVGALGADVPATVPGVLAIVIGLVGAGVVMLGLAVLLLALLMVLREAGAFASLAAVLLPFSAGVYFPRDILPTPLREIAGVLPFHTPVDVIRSGLVDGVFPVGEVLVLIAASVVFLGLACVAAGPAVGHARRVGRLALE